MKSVIFIILIAALGIFGEVRCLYQFFTSDFEPNYKRELVYGISAFTGLGAVVGWFDIPDTIPTK